MVLAFLYVASLLSVCAYLFGVAGLFGIIAGEFIEPSPLARAVFWSLLWPIWLWQKRNLILRR